MKKIEILGLGCPRCVKTEEIVREAVKDLGFVEGEDYIIEKVKNPADIAEKGVLMTPGICINGKVVSSGKIPTKSQIQTWVLS